MKATELRIGNLVLSNGILLRVDTIEIDGCSGQLLNPKQEPNFNKGLEPIPLTEEWLVRFGFELSQSNKHIFSIDASIKEFTVLKYKNLSDILPEYKHLNHIDFVISFPTYYDDVNFYGFKYVNQIQNLYFALTGEELILKNK